MNKNGYNEIVCYMFTAHYYSFHDCSLLLFLFTYFCLINISVNKVLFLYDNPIINIIYIYIMSLFVRVNKEFDLIAKQIEKIFNLHFHINIEERFILTLYFSIHTGIKI